MKNEKMKNTKRKIMWSIKPENWTQPYKIAICLSQTLWLKYFSNSSRANDTQSFQVCGLFSNILTTRTTPSGSLPDSSCCDERRMVKQMLLIGPCPVATGSYARYLLLLKYQGLGHSRRRGVVLFVLQWTCYMFGVIVRVRIVFRKTAVGDWLFDYLSGSHLQSHVSEDDLTHESLGSEEDVSHQQQSF